MKKYLSAFFATSFAGLFLVSCSQPAIINTPPTPIQIYLMSPSPTEILESSLPTSTPVVTQPIPDLSFEDLADTIFVFCGGAGAWSTEVRISPDGTFSGFYYDLDMGDSSNDYPDGTQYECSFNGRFSDLKKTGEYEYSMKCESLTQEGYVNEVKIGEDGLRHITSEPYGFDHADEFILYLPGKRIDELPFEYTNWVGIYVGSESDGMHVLSFYGLYNVGGKEGFSSEETGMISKN